MALTISIIRPRLTGLSHTATSSGLLEEALTSPQDPSAKLNRTPLIVFTPLTAGSARK